MKSPDDEGRWALWVDPSPSTAEPLGFIYRRRPRTLRWAGTETEARSYTAGGSASASTATTSTALPSSMVGSIIRFGTAATHPSGLAGNSPFIEQHKIKSISSTTVTLDGTLSQAHSSAKIVVSDPIDMNDQMQEALKAQLEYRLARFSNDTRDMMTAKQIADAELRRVLESESRHFSGRGGSSHSRYNYMFRHLDGQITTDG